MSDRNERSDRLQERFESEPNGETDAKPDKSDKTATTDTNDKPDKNSKSTETAVKDRPSVLMYLPEDVRQELDIRFDELNAQHRREHGEALGKNRDFYPAVVQAGLTGKDLEDILDL